MRYVGQALPRYMAPAGYREQGLGFSWGGFHPFRINDYKSAVKKIDSNLFKISGLDKVGIFRNLHNNINTQIGKVDQTISKDFQKTKHWSQEHRKQLQIVAAIAAAVITGGAALGYFGAVAGTEGAAAAGIGAAAEGAAGAAGAVTATEAASVAASAVEAGTAAEIGTTTAAYMVPETLTPIVTSTAAAAPEIATIAPGVMTQAASGSSLLSYAKTAASLAKDVVPIMALSKALGVTSGGQTPATGQTAVNVFGGGGGWSGGGSSGGGSMGPLWSGADQSASPATQPETMPPWVIPAAGIGLLVLLLGS